MLVPSEGGGALPGLQTWLGDVAGRTAGFAPRERGTRGRDPPPPRTQAILDAMGRNSAQDPVMPAYAAALASHPGRVAAADEMLATVSGGPWTHGRDGWVTQGKALRHGHVLPAVPTAV